MYQLSSYGFGQAVITILMSIFMFISYIPWFDYFIFMLHVVNIDSLKRSVVIFGLFFYMLTVASSCDLGVLWPLRYLIPAKIFLPLLGFWISRQGMTSEQQCNKHELWPNGILYLPQNRKGRFDTKRTTWIVLLIANIISFKENIHLLIYISHQFIGRVHR